MSDSTKRALARSLAAVLEKKPLDKITITDLTDHCGVNRQTFYYHFHDIYDLIEWIYVTFASEAIGDHRTYGTWQEGMLDMMKAMLEHRDFLLKTYHSRSGGHLGDILLEKSYDLLIGVVNEVARDYRLSAEDRSFIADFYKYSYAGITLEWIDGGMKEDPQIIVNRVETIMQGTFQEAIRRFASRTVRH
jgi:probable dihydroxyacetone kinase regulator